ncbi:MAG TPA: GNAT family N-acetyltransferase [Longimicrobiales bacterium]
MNREPRRAARPGGTAPDPAPRAPARHDAAAHDAMPARGAPAEVRLGPLSPHERPAVEAIVRRTGVFRDDEIAVALEVLDAYLARPEQDYHALGAFTPGGDLLGFTLYGPTPCTLGTWDLYWIAVAPDAQGTGVGTLLLQEVERRLADVHARLVVIETSSQAAYAATRAFYRRRGYAEAARVPDFYADGDDRVIFAKRLPA